MIAASHSCDELNKTGSPASSAGISSTMAASSRPSLAILGMIAASYGCDELNKTGSPASSAANVGSNDISSRPSLAV
jgi:hypothetical protein